MIFKTKIKGDTIKRRGLKKLDGKRVSVTVTEIKSIGKKQWELLSSLKLGGILDHKNIRDIIYE